jgi:pimeloyl-ACP methyl ester carboxylesterase
MVTRKKAGPFNYFDWGGAADGPLIHFAHGNGFPPLTYSPFIERFLPQYRLIGWECFGEDFPVRADELIHWRQLVRQMATFFSAGGFEPAILVGHSLGAVLSLYAAAELHYRIQAIVLIDPVIFSREFLFVWRQMRRFFGMTSVPLARMTRQKRDNWSSIDEVRKSYRKKPLFRDWQEQSFQRYLEGALIDAGNGSGVRLRYPREWEARIFDTTPNDFWRIPPARSSAELAILRGGRSKAFTPHACRQLSKLYGGARTRVFDGLGHCLIMENPAAIADEVIHFLLSANLSPSLISG